MNNLEFESKFKDYQNKINSRLDNILSIADIPQKEVIEAMKYSLGANGKRIRPILCTAVCEMLSHNMDITADEREALINDAIYVGCAIECIHTYSLIHDDLPCMDDDDLRRGKPSCHIKFGESTALLAGDGLLNFAFELLSDLSEYSYIKSDKIIKIISELSKNSGVYGMIGGQIIDLACENKTDADIKLLTKMHRLKTGALLRASAVCGAIASGASDEIIDKIISFAMSLGLAFQIKDDILDFVGDEKLLGKPVGGDLKCNKTTYVSLISLENAEKELNVLTKQAEDTVSELDFSEFLVCLSEFLLGREY